MDLSEEEIGTLTPLLFHALLERKRKADKAAYQQAGIVAAAVINFSMGHPDKPVNEMDFVPAWLKDKETEGADFDLRKLSPEAQAEYVLKQFSKRHYTKRG